MKRNWLLIGFVVGLVGIANAQDELKPGGVELTTLSDGTPAVGVDLAAVVANPTKSPKPWYSRAWSATTNNMAENPKTWISGAVAFGAAASQIGKGGGGSKKQTQTKETKPQPSVVVQGHDNAVTAPATVVNSENPSVVVQGHDNDVTLTDPPVTTP